MSVAILLSRVTECPFVAKGGGHAAFRGGSNSDGGITIDFAQMKHVDISPDGKSVAIGPGNTWLDVYTALEKVNLTMAGGRTANVGVGGLALGGRSMAFSANSATSPPFPISSYYPTYLEIPYRGDFILQW